MTKYEQAIVEVQIETAENRIRTDHNDIESRRIIGKKNFMPYNSSKFIAMVKLFREDCRLDGKKN